jgi:hypothetical protein
VPKEVAPGGGDHGARSRVGKAGEQEGRRGRTQSEVEEVVGTGQTLVRARPWKRVGGTRSRWLGEGREWEGGRRGEARRRKPLTSACTDKN